jgi:hypothetical protein
MIISFTGWPSTDSTADIETSIAIIGTLSPRSVITEDEPRGVVTDPEI